MGERGLFEHHQIVKTWIIRAAAEAAAPVQEALAARAVVVVHQDGEEEAPAGPQLASAETGGGNGQAIGVPTRRSLAFFLAHRDFHIRGDSRPASGEWGSPTGFRAVAGQGEIQFDPFERGTAFAVEMEAGLDSQPRSALGARRKWSSTVRTVR